MKKPKKLKVKLADEFREHFWKLSPEDRDKALDAINRLRKKLEAGGTPPGKLVTKKEIEEEKNPKVKKLLENLPGARYIDI